MQSFTAKKYKASIERAAADACTQWPTDAEMRARTFCAFLSGDISFAEPALAAALCKVAGIAPSKRTESAAP